MRVDNFQNLEKPNNQEETKDQFEIKTDGEQIKIDNKFLDEGFSPKAFPGKNLVADYI